MIRLCLLYITTRPKWNVISYWFFRYLETERKYSSDAVLVTMVVAVVVLASGYFIGGAVGLIVCTVAVMTSRCQVHSTALAIQSFIEEGSSALAPVTAGLIAVAAYLVPRDIETLRAQMRERAEYERAAQSA